MKLVNVVVIVKGVIVPLENIGKSHLEVTMAVNFAAGKVL